MADIIAYYRVSTKQQGESGLGLEAQQMAVEQYARQMAACLKASYVEVESGKRADRPQLLKALAHAKRNKAVLVVAKLDRLGRNVHFLTGLMEAKVPFVCCDNPHANELTIGMLAVMAQHEAKMIADRTKKALAAAKARGQQLGSDQPGHWDGKVTCPKCHGDEAKKVDCPKCSGRGETDITRRDARLAGLARGRINAVKELRKKAAEAYADILPLMQQLRADGLSLQKIADRLTADGHSTRRGKAWNAMQVKNVLDRITGTK